jgi:hypothetical protein
MKSFFTNVWSVLTSTRFKSFYWRAIMMGIATVLTYATNNITSLNLGTETTVIIGLVLGEVSKSVNNNIKAMQSSDNS